MLSDEIQSYFSCKRENTQWLSTLVLNHISVSNLSTLIAHNYKFFNNTFDNIILLDLCLKFKKGFNYRSLDCKTKNRYFSELKYLIKDYNFTRCSRTFIISEALDFAQKFKGNGVNFFESSTEMCYDKEPNCRDYLVSKTLEFPYSEEMIKDIYNEKNKKKFLNREGKVNVFKKMSREELIVIIKDLKVEDFNVDKLEFEPLDFQHPLEGYEPADLTELDKKELNDAKKVLKERKDQVTFMLRDLYKSRFIYTDVNHLNRPLIMKNSMSDYFDMAEEEKKKLVEGFKFFHGVRGFEIVGGEKELDEFRGSFHFLKNRLTLMGGVSEEIVGVDTWSQHMDILKDLKQINIKLKKVEARLLKAENNVVDLQKRMAELELSKYDLMLKIKALYPRWTFIEDEYLDRDTSSWKNADLCSFIKAALKFRKTSEDFFTPSEKVPGRNKLSEGLGRLKVKEDESITKLPNYKELKNEAENKLREAGLYIPKSGSLTEQEAQQLSVNDYLDSKRVYTIELERMQACAGYDIADMLAIYFVDPNDAKEKDLNFRLEKAKKEYNFMIKNKKNWAIDEHDYFLKNLELIFEMDEDFEKYLTSDFKNDLKERIKVISDEISTVIRISSSCPKCFDEKQELVRLNSEKEKNSVKSGSDKIGQNLIKLMDSFIEMDLGITRKGGLKLKELGESSSRGSKSKKKSKSKNFSEKDEITQLWEKNKNENANKLIKLVNSYKRIYNSLGDATILDPQKYGINPYYCSCTKEQPQKGLHMHYRNATIRNLNIYQAQELEALKLKEEVEKAENRLKVLNKKKEDFNKFKANCEELDRKNAEYIKMREIERERVIEDIKKRIDSAKINKSIENSSKFLSQVRENWNSVIERCSYNVNEKNKLLLRRNREINNDFYKKLSLEKVKFFKESITKVARETNEIKAKKKLERQKKKFDDLVRLGLERPKEVKSKNKFELLYEEDSDDEESSESEDEDEDEELNTYEDYENKWIKIAKEKKEKQCIAQVELIEVGNKYELMYHDARALRYAEDSANTFLASSKNIRLLSDLRIRNEKQKKIRELRDGVLERDGYCEKELLAQIHLKCRSHFVKEYSVTNIKPILILLFLCMVNKVPVDCKYVRLNYGMKRCQVNYIYNSVKCSMRLLEKSMNTKSESIVSF